MIVLRCCTDPISEKDYKYVWLAANSQFKSESDLQKYEKARKLKAGTRQSPRSSCSGDRTGLLTQLLVCQALKLPRMPMLAVP